MSHISVTVFCGSSMGAAPSYRQAAEALGAGFAARDIRLVFGAGNVGLMGTLAGAVLGGGGEVSGIIPDFLRAKEVEFPGLTSLVITDSMHTRKRRMFALADAFAVLPGGLGTLDELMEILTWKQLGQHHKPIILIDIEGWAGHVAALLDNIVEAGFARPAIRNLFEIVPDVAAALDRLAQVQPYSRSSGASSDASSDIGNL